MADFDTLLDEVLQKLPLLNVAQLEECCTQLQIDVPAEKKGQKRAVRSLVSNHLNHDDFADDEDVIKVLT